MKGDKKTTEIANYFNVDLKSSFRRLKELEKLGLVKRREDRIWEIMSTNKKVIVL